MRLAGRLAHGGRLERSLARPCRPRHPILSPRSTRRTAVYISRRCPPYHGFPEATAPSIPSFKSSLPLLRDGMRNASPQYGTMVPRPRTPRPGVADRVGESVGYTPVDGGAHRFSRATLVSASMCWSHGTSMSHGALMQHGEMQHGEANASTARWPQGSGLRNAHCRSMRGLHVLRDVVGCSGTDVSTADRYVDATPAVSPSEGAGFGAARCAASRPQAASAGHASQLRSAAQRMRTPNDRHGLHAPPPPMSTARADESHRVGPQARLDGAPATGLQTERAANRANQTTPSFRCYLHRLSLAAARWPSTLMHALLTTCSPTLPSTA